MGTPPLESPPQGSGAFPNVGHSLSAGHGAGTGSVGHAEPGKVGPDDP